jgi:hypothetical protein
VRIQFAGVSGLPTGAHGALTREVFNPLQARQVAERFNAEGVDYLASKKASGRLKDRLDLHLLELFRQELERRGPGR